MKLLPLVSGLVTSAYGTIIGATSTSTVRLRHESALFALSILRDLLLLLLQSLLVILFAAPDQVIFVRLLDADLVLSEHLLKYFLRVLIDVRTASALVPVISLGLAVLLPPEALLKDEVGAIRAELLVPAMHLLNLCCTEHELTRVCIEGANLRGVRVRTRGWLAYLEAEN